MILGYYFFWSFGKINERLKITDYLYFSVWGTGSQETTALFEDHYSVPPLSAVAFPHKRNLVVIEMESMEGTYSRADLFGVNLIPRLSALAARNLSFAGWHSTRGATWTIAALSAYLLGVPLALDGISKIKDRPAGMNNGLWELQAGFLPGASSILTVLEENGYRISAFLGSNKAFAGFDKLITTHTARAEIFDDAYYREHRLVDDDPQRNARWGTPDHVIYAAAEDYLTHLPQDAPFCLLLQTIDTHWPKGHANGVLPPRWGDIRDCYAEADVMADDFVQWCSRQDFYADTTVIILGDHLSPLDTLGLSAPPPADAREIFTAVINSEFPSGTVRRNFGSFDLAPTLLQLAGGRWAGFRFGLGTGLLSPVPTLFERRGLDYYTAEMGKRSAFYRTLLSPRASSPQAQGAAQ